VPIVKRPVFVAWIALVVQVPLQLFLTLWAGGFFGGLLSAVLHLHSRVPFIAIGTMALIGIPCVAYFGKKLNYSRTTYTFYDDRIEFEEGFFARNKKVIKYRDILEITLRQGILQRVVGLGTIYLGTLATGSGPRANPFYALGFGNISASGVGVRDINDPDTVYAQIQRLIESARR
jgi:uncharacterized membrane protein YdbT with pleckstrin-like domain